MNPLAPKRPSTLIVLVLLASFLPVFGPGCKDDQPTAPDAASGPPPIAVNWENLPYKMLVTQREYVGFKSWSEKPDGRIGRIRLLDPSTRTISTVLESTIYEFPELRVNHSTSQWYFISDNFQGGGWPKVLMTTPQGEISRVSETPEGVPEDLAVTRSGQVAFFFYQYSGWGPNTKSGIWVGSNLFISGTAVDFGGLAWADETHLLLSRTLGNEEGVYRISVPDKNGSLLFGPNSPPLAGKTTEGWATVQNPEVSPEGDCFSFQAIYTDRASVRIHSLWTIHAQDTMEILHEAQEGTEFWESRISPDGKYIAVDRGDIWILRIDGSGSSCVITGGWIGSFDWL